MRFHVCIPLIAGMYVWLLAFKCMLQRLHKADSVPEPAPASCVSSSEPVNRDEFTLTRISASVSSVLHRAGQSLSCFALFESVPLETTHASVIGSPQSAALYGSSYSSTVRAPYNAGSAVRESKLLKNNQALKKETMQ